MDYEKLYREALERAKKVNECKADDREPGTRLCEYIFPELKESEDEKIRKEIITNCRNTRCVTEEGAEKIAKWIAWLEKQGGKTQQTPQWMINFLDENRVKFASSMDDYDEQREAEGKLLAIIDWLEKQGEQKSVDKAKPKESDDEIIPDKNGVRDIEQNLAGNDERIRNTLIKFHKATIDIDGIKGSNIVDWLEKQVSEPNWCHHKVDLSGYSEEYRKAYYDGWNNCNMQHSQCKIELDDVVKCLINGMKFYYEDNEDATWGTEKWSMPVKHIIDVLEKQVPVDEDKVARGVRQDVALSIINYLNRNTLGMCLSGMERADLESAVVDSDWSKVYDYMKMKLEKQGESDKPLYIRFGDIPTNGKSNVYNGEIEIGIEEGVSVYPAFETNGDIVIGLSLPITRSTLHTQQALLEYESRPCYLVTGDYVGKGTDGEPLIKNVRIIKEIKPYRIKQEKENNP